MLLGSDILRLFSLDPIFLLASLLGVWCWLPLRSSTPTSAACLSALLWPTAHSVVLASLWVASSTLVRVPFPLPDTARFQVQESFVWFRAKTDSSALAACPHSATYLPLLPLSFILNKLHHDLTTSKKKTWTFTGNKNRNYKILKGFGRPLKK